MHGRGMSIAKWVQSLSVMLCLLAGLAIGCGNERICFDNPPEPKPKPTRTTPNGLLDMFVQAYEAKDLNMYSELLAEGYEFCFEKPGYAPPEIATDTCLSRSEDLSSTQSMFEDPRIGAINISFTKALEWISCSEDTVEGFCCVLAPSITVTIKDALGARAGTAARSNPSTWGYLKLAFGDNGHALEAGTVSISRCRLYVTVIPDRQHPGLWAILSIREDQV